MLAPVALVVLSAVSHAAPGAWAAAPKAWTATAKGEGAQALGRVTDSLIQIGIVQNAESLTLRPQGAFSVVDQTTGQSQKLEASRSYLLQGEPGGVDFGPYRFRGELRLLPKIPQTVLEVGSKEYRGNFIVKPNADGTFTVVHELGLEEYLYGVLAGEMMANWPIEALKAQAVVARTFALANMGRFESSGFDLSDDARSQKYVDAPKQFPDAVRAVRKTEGQVLKWRGSLLPVFFHSCCGGHTTDPGVFWRFHARFPKPLKGVLDPYCKISPHHDWTAYFTNDDILAAAQKPEADYGELRSIRIEKRDRAGFVKTLRIIVGRKGYSVSASDFRRRIGVSELKSTKITRIVKKRNGFYFVGHGFGHGVGLCQYGALALAKRSKSYTQILRFYFPGAELAHYDE